LEEVTAREKKYTSHMENKIGKQKRVMGLIPIFEKRF